MLNFWSNCIQKEQDMEHSYFKSEPSFVMPSAGLKSSVFPLNRGFSG